MSEREDICEKSMHVKKGDRVRILVDQLFGDRKSGKVGTVKMVPDEYHVIVLVDGYILAQSYYHDESITEIEVI